MRSSMFISYSRKDRRFLDELRTRLIPFERQYDLKIWDDSQLVPGLPWKPAILEAVAQASVGILLVSPNFLASKFVTEVELPKLLDAGRRGGLIPCIIHIRASSSHIINDLSELQALNDPRRPVARFRGHARDEEWERIAAAIVSRFERKTTNIDRQRHLELLNTINRLLVRYCNCLENMCQAFEYVGEQAFESTDDFKELSDAILAYNSTFEEIQERRNEFVASVSEQSQASAEQLREILLDLELAFHAGHVVQLNEVRVRILKLHRKQVADSDVSRMREETRALMQAQLRALRRKPESLRQRVDAFYSYAHGLL